MRDYFFETDGYRDGDPVFCPLNAFGDCPYCDKRGHCRMADPVADCDDFAAIFPTWEDWFSADDVDPEAPTDFAEDEIRWAGDVYGYEDTMEDNEDE